MKFDVTRRCKHTERVKVYDAFPLNAKKNERHVRRILGLEGLKHCRECRVKLRANRTR